MVLKPVDKDGDPYVFGKIQYVKSNTQGGQAQYQSRYAQLAHMSAVEFECEIDDLQNTAGADVDDRVFEFHGDTSLD